LSNGLDKLIYLYSVDTSSFYNDKEYEIDKQIILHKQYKSNLLELLRPLNTFRTESNKILKKDEENNEKLHKLEDKLINFVKKYSIFIDKINEYMYFDKINNTYEINNKSSLFLSEQYLNRKIREMKIQLDVESGNHKGKRILRFDNLKDSNKISLFESTLTRSLGIQENELTTDIIVIRTYRYIIFEDLIKNGFKLPNGEVFEYLSSSAGQIRTKKSMFINTKKLNANKHEIRNKLMCGLSINKINRKGGINQNKFQAYLSLSNSASTKWNDFDIERCIVVKDMELNVNGWVEYIDHKNYKIKKIKKEIPIQFMDGAGVMLPSVSEKSFQFRMPFFKGLLVPFNYLEFIKEYPNAKFIIKDIYGTEHDVLKENIQIIFTKSQFKLSAYYSDWDEYKYYFNEFNCESAICKIEEDLFEDKPINYQMIQSLSFSENELKQLSERTSKDILTIGEDKNAMLRLLGADDDNVKKNYFQKALSIYPKLLNDEHSKQSIKDRKKSLVKEAKSGKILLAGTKRSYISPDVYAFAEWLFAGIEKPNGLLQNGEVSCKLFENENLDVLRSPHLYREHAVRKNILNDDTNKWFITNCIYTSVHDMISKQLMFDVDGDDALIINNKLFVERAEQQMKNILPLDYTLAVAKKTRITKDHIVHSLKAAYSKNIGEISNLITKIWNSGLELNKDEMDLIKILCMENNACIDFAKTLWMPERPSNIENQIKKFSNKKVPYFFQFAKDKEEMNVERKNNSTINKLTEVIPNKRINFVKVIGKFDYKNLMRNKRHKNYNELSKYVIKEYIRLDRSKSDSVKNQVKGNDKINMQTEIEIYKNIRKHLLNIIDNSFYITDILVKYLFDEKNSKYKDTLWRCFGKEIISNLEHNILGIKRCQCCGIKIENVNSKKYCDNCSKEKRLEKHKKYNKKRNKRPNEHP
jgi:hypothetical protein